MNEKMSSKTNVLNWFEISTTDIKRARQFYEDIFEIQMEEMNLDGIQYAMFPYDPQYGKIAGALAQSEMHKPGTTGSIIYLNANPDLQLVLNKVEKSGGKITMPKTSIGPNGYMAMFLDTEGNIMALHSNT